MKNIMQRIGGDLIVALTCLTMFGLAGTLFAQPISLVPTLPPGKLLDIWEFSGTNFLSVLKSAPTSLTNVSLVPTWAGNGLQVDDTNAAWIIYPVIDPSGRTNLDCSQGTIEMWFSPDWNSSDGIGNWGTVLEVGTWDTNLATATGAWGLYISPDASTLYFSAQTNGTLTNYLNAPIAWYAGDWHHIAVTFSATNSALYLEGQLITNGPGVSLIPSAGVQSNGFSIGSDGNATGQRQIRGIFNNLITYNYQLVGSTVSNYYAADSEFVYPLPSSGGFHGDSAPTPPAPGGGGTNTGGGGTFTSPSFSATDFYLESKPFGTNIYNTDPNSVTFLLHNTTNSEVYQLWSTTNLAPPVVWTVQQTFLGATNTNFTAIVFSITNEPVLYFKAVDFSLDSDGDGLPDFWELQHGLDPTKPDSGNAGVIDAYKLTPANDGLTYMDCFLAGLNPSVWNTPPAPLGLAAKFVGTNNAVQVSWQPSPGPVTNYTISRYDNATGASTFFSVGLTNQFVDTTYTNWNFFFRFTPYMRFKQTTRGETRNGALQYCLTQEIR